MGEIYSHQNGKQVEENCGKYIYIGILHSEANHVEFAFWHIVE